MVRIDQKQLNLIKTKVSCYLQFPQASHFSSQAEQLPELSPSRHINNSFSVYHFLDSESQLGKSKELNNQAMKVHVKRAFISHSFLLQKKKNADRLCMKFSSTLNTVVKQVPQPPISKFSTPYSAASFLKENLNPEISIDKMINEEI